MGVRGHLRIELAKEIPVGSGLGGGSSDAAAILAACDRLFGTALEAQDLEEMAAHLGSDVPFFIRGGTMLGRGRGTELTPLPPILRGVFLIVKPEIELITSQVYDKLKMGLTLRSPKANISGVKSLITRFPTSSWFGFNRLEEVVLPDHPALQRIVLRLRELAPVVMLTGSGSAVVAVFSEEGWSPKITDEFAQLSSFVRVVLPHPTGVEFMEG
jgi:4-diphosphocytidyl-2-C-methyl-D-erythritol kinase